MLRAVDLFAGAGGYSEAARQAGIEIVWTGNHNPTAVEYHAKNHPQAIHVCQDLHQADWTQLPKHDILLASPCCQGHTPARGKDRPYHDIQRSTAWAVVSCAEYHKEELVLVENVPAFRKWILYPAWRHAMESLGYSMAPFIIDAADHGVAQHRARLFLAFTRSKHPIQIKLEREEHIGIGSVIEWDEHAWNPICRPGRVDATLRRIQAGRERFGPRFVAPYYGSGSGTTGRSIDRPIGTITTVDRWSVINGDYMRMLQPSEVRTAMGFPRHYLLPRTRRAAVHLLGNAVCPPVAKKLLIALRAAA